MQLGPWQSWTKLGRISSVKSDWSTETQSSASFTRPSPRAWLCNAPAKQGRSALDCTEPSYFNTFLSWTVNVVTMYCSRFADYCSKYKTTRPWRWVVSGASLSSSVSAARLSCLVVAIRWSRASLSCSVSDARLSRWVVSRPLSPLPSQLPACHAGW